MEFTRRNFMGTSAAAVLAAGTMARGTVFGANDKIRMCVIGFNGQGSSHIREILKRSADAEIVALCDVDSKVRERGAAFVEKESGKKPKLYKDMREVMADKDIDAVSIATPNHWHTLAAIWACQAGKDVYVEKPLSHGIWEGRQLVAAAKKYNRVVVHGTQSRSNPTLVRDIQLIHDGFIGKIVHSRGYVYKNGNRNAIGRGKTAQAPENLDWALWQGPSKEQAYRARTDKDAGLVVPYNWHWFWEYGNGEIGNQGVHEMDIAVWGHKRGLPVKVYTTGGRYGWDDDGETPNTQATSFTYEDGSMLTFEVRNLGSFNEACEGDCSNSFFGTEGYYVRGSGFFNYKKEPISVDDKPKSTSTNHWDNFFKAVRSRKPEDNFASVEVGHASCVHCHLGNTSYRLGRELLFDPKKEMFKKDKEANKYLKREYREGFEVPELA